MKKIQLKLTQQELYKLKYLAETGELDQLLNGTVIDLGRDIDLDNTELQSSPNPLPLSDWLQGIYETVWRPVKELVASTPAFAASQEERAKLITLEMNNQSFVLRIRIKEAEEPGTFRIRLQLSLNQPTETEPYLPPGTNLIIFDDSGTPCWTIRSDQTDEHILCEFIGTRGESLSYQVSLQDAEFTETLVI